SSAGQQRPALLRLEGLRQVLVGGIEIGKTKKSSQAVQLYVRRSVLASVGCGSLPIRRIRPPQR
ncbi:MAG: hypothetical protein WA723_16935, partial [Pseudolabrys sp.]